MALCLVWPRALVFALAASAEDPPFILRRYRTTHLPYGLALAAGGIAAVVLSIF
jgi:hypothetical protein